jgi:hypothetical protein
MNRNVNVGTNWYRKKGTQSSTGMLWNRTDTQDAGMPMPATLTSMRMPSYAFYLVKMIIISCKGHVSVRFVLVRSLEMRKCGIRMSLAFFLLLPGPLAEKTGS